MQKRWTVALCVGVAVIAAGGGVAVTLALVGPDKAAAHGPTGPRTTPVVAGGGRSATGPLGGAGRKPAAHASGSQTTSGSSQTAAGLTGPPAVGRTVVVSTPSALPPGATDGDGNAPEAAANALFAAWAANDQTAAAKVASASSVSTLFATAYSASSDRFVGCRLDDAGDTVCSYSDASGYVDFYVDGYQSVWTVTDVLFDSE